MENNLQTLLKNQREEFSQNYLSQWRWVRERAVKPSAEDTLKNYQLQILSAVKDIRTKKTEWEKAERERIVKLIEKYEIKKQPLCEQNVLLRIIKEKIKHL